MESVSQISAVAMHEVLLSSRYKLWEFILATSEAIFVYAKDSWINFASALLDNELTKLLLDEIFKFSNTDLEELIIDCYLRRNFPF